MSHLRTLLQEAGVEIAPDGHHHARGGWVQFDCPFCSPGTRRYRMGFNERSGYTNCWTCGYHSTAAVLQRVMSITRDKATSLVAEHGLFTRRRLDEEFSNKRGKLVKPKGLMPNLLTVHSKYLKGRGFNCEEIQKVWKIESIGFGHGTMSWRIWIPIHYMGEVVSWTTRVAFNNHRTRTRYYSAKPDQEILPHKELLYGEDFARNKIVVVEGPLDVWAIGPGAVCTFGTAFTQTQVNRIAKYPVRSICFDNDPDAQRKAKELCKSLSVFPGETNMIVLDNCKDAGDASPADLKAIRRQFIE